MVEALAGAGESVGWVGRRSYIALRLSCSTTGDPLLAAPSTPVSSATERTRRLALAPVREPPLHKQRSARLLLLRPPLSVQAK